MTEQYIFLQYDLLLYGKWLAQALNGIDSDLAATVSALELVTVSFAVAYTATKKQIDVIQKFSAKVAVPDFGGFDPYRLKGVLKRIRDLWNRAVEAWKSVFVGVVKLLVMGVVLPALFLCAVVVGNGIVFGGSTCLLTWSETNGCEGIGPREAIEFTIDQSFKGAGNDIAEVYRLDLADVENNTENHFFSILVIMFRLLTGAVGLAIAAFTLRFALSIGKLTGEIARWAIQLPYIWLLEKLDIPHPKSRSREENVEA